MKLLAELLSDLDTDWGRTLDKDRTLDGLE